MGLGLHPRTRSTLGLSWDTLGMTESAPGATDMIEDNTKFELGLRVNFYHVLILMEGSGSQKRANY